MGEINRVETIDRIVAWCDDAAAAPGGDTIYHVATTLRAASHPIAVYAEIDRAIDRVERRDPKAAEIVVRTITIGGDFLALCSLYCDARRDAIHRRTTAPISVEIAQRLERLATEIEAEIRRAHC